VTAEAGFDWTEVHFYLGYTSLGLIAFRVIWGFVGPRHARFSSFMRGPRATLEAIQDLPRKQASAVVGRGALGAWSTVVILGLVATQATTGLFISDDIFWAGPYNTVVSDDTAGFLASVHHTNFNVLQGMVVLHLLTITWYAIGKRQNLVAPMLHGKKPLDATQQYEAIESSMILRALLVGAVVATAVTLVVQLAPEPALDDYF
jgi:cytochrome b